MLWEIDIYPAPGQADLLGQSVAAAAAELGLAADLKVCAARGYLIQSDWDHCQAERVAQELLTDRVVERAQVAPVGNVELISPPWRIAHSYSLLVHVLPKPGVMDPVAQSVM